MSGKYRCPGPSSPTSGLACRNRLSQQAMLERLQSMAGNLYSVSPGERPILVREAVQLSEKVIFVDDEVSDPFALVVAESEGRAYEIGAPVFMSD